MKHIAAQYFLNTDLRTDELKTQAKMLCDAGFEEIFLHSRAGLKTPYLSKEWFNALKTVIEELRKNDVKFSIWDDDNFPSALAGNRIVNAFPELSASNLDFKIIDGKSGEKVSEFFPQQSFILGCFAVSDAGEITDISEHCGTQWTEWKPAFTSVSSYSPHGQLPTPHRRRAMHPARPVLSFTPEKDCRIVTVLLIYAPQARHNSDLLNAETTKRFIEFTFEAYKKALGCDLIRESGRSSFFDEPAPDGCFPWTRSFPEEFKKQHGYDLLPLLPHLVLDISEESAKIRNDYRTTEHMLICKNYLGQLKSYLNKEGLLSAGHLTRSEWLSLANTRWPNELRCLKYADIPCGDPLGASVGRLGSTAYHIGLKVIASAARLFNCKAAGSDAFAVGGDSISLRNLKFQADYHLAMGITWFNVHGLDYTIEGGSIDETPPSLFYQHAQWPHMRVFLTYLKERCELLTGEHQCEIEMLYPDTMLKCMKPGDNAPDASLHSTAELLLSHQQDFELIDEMTLCEHDPAALAALRPFFIVAHTSRIVKSTAEFLERYTAAGGKLILTGSVPQIIDLPGAPKWSFADKYLLTDFLAALPDSPLEGEGKEAVLLRKVKKEDGRVITFIFNRSEMSFIGTFNGKALHLAPGESKLDSEIEPSAGVLELPVPSQWKMSFCRPNSVPLAFWEYRGGCVKLFSRHKQEELPFDDAEYFYSRFMAAPGLQVILTVEEGMLKDGVFCVNGHDITDFVQADFRDCRERECDITPFLKQEYGFATNIIGWKGKNLFENPPYLRGRFQAQVMPEGEGFPRLSPAPADCEFINKADYRDFGYGTYSGPARCTANAAVKDSGRYFFAVNEIYDSARLIIDGADLGICIAPPYRWEFDLAAGDHTIEIEIYNNSGNRDRMLGLPAGIKC